MSIAITVIVVVFLLSCIKIVQEYERGVKFTLGRYTGTMGAGVNFIVPVFQTFQKVDMRVRTSDVPGQECVTGDNISVHVDAVMYYKVTDASRAVLEVESYQYATSRFALTTMRNVVGQVELDQLLSQREEISNQIREIVDKHTEPWGIKVEMVELKDISLPEEMKRVIARQAEAERERRAVIIRAEGERIAADNLVIAAKQLSSAGGALHLRTLNTLTDLASDQSNTVIFAIPVEVLRAFSRLGGDEGGQDGGLTM